MGLPAAVRAVLIDLSGTLHIDNAVTPRALDALAQLRASGVSIRFASNTTKESARAVVARLTRIGFKIEAHEVITSLSAARRLLEESQLRPHLLVSEAALDEFEGIDTSDPNAVLVGLAPKHFTYDRLNEVFRLLRSRPDVPLLAINKSRYYERPDGLALGAGAFVAALEFSTGRTADVVGKPSRLFFQRALAEVGVEARDAVMIGDDTLDDVYGAQQAGIAGVLVRTGKFRDGDETSAPTPPDLVCDSFADAVDQLLPRIARATEPSFVQP